jgi:hypothetical protein
MLSSPNETATRGVECGKERLDCLMPRGHDGVGEGRWWQLYWKIGPFINPQDFTEFKMR